MVMQEGMEFLVLTTEEAVKNNSVFILIEIPFDTTRTVVPAFVVPKSMLTIGALKLPSLMGLCEVRERKRNGINDSYF